MVRVVVARWIRRGARQAAAAIALRRLWTRAPVTLVVLVTMTILFAAAQAGGAPRRLADVLALYRGDALFHGELWRLPLSALLAQGWLQWAWTLFIGVTLLAAVEARVGSRRTVLVLALSHIAPTVAVDACVRAAGAPALLSAPDFGTSCLLMGGAGAALWLWRSRLLAGALIVICVGDMLLNSTMTIAEHVLAVMIGAAVAALLRVPEPQAGTVPVQWAPVHRDSSATAA